MSLPRYGQYKDSQLDWLGHVPAHWHVKRLRFVAELNPSKSELAGVDRATEVSFLPMEAIGDDGSISLDRTRPIAEVETGYTYFRNGDVTLAKITPCFENGKGALMRGLEAGIGFGTTELIVARPKPSEVIGSLLNWIFRSPNFRAQGEASMYGAGGQKRVPDDFVRDFAWAFPPANEQPAIAAFLDRETAKIDVLIAEQEKLIALLAEKRQATISHAVTRGLNPDAPMKDSGVAWLGAIPAHWSVAPIKSFGWLRGGAGFPHEEQGVQGESLDFFKVAALGAADERGVLQRGEHTVSRGTATRLGAFVFPARSVVFAKVGAALMLGRVRELANDACLDNNMLGIVVNSNNEPAFLRYAMALVRFDLIANPGAVPSLNEGQIGNYPLVKPPLREQSKIVEFLDTQTARLDTLRLQAERAIGLLKERRSALIAAAVTGQVDVRAAAQA